MPVYPTRKTSLKDPKFLPIYPNLTQALYTVYSKLVISKANKEVVYRIPKTLADPEKVNEEFVGNVRGNSEPSSLNSQLESFNLLIRNDVRITLRRLTHPLRKAYAPFFKGLRTPSQRLTHPGGGGGGAGDESHMKRTEMLVGNFEFNP